MLSEAGFGILMFDWAGHGGSEGKVQWAANERAALGAGIDWLARQSGLDPKRIGAYGVSMGGVIVTQVAASDQRLRAVALLGTPSNQREQVRFQHAKVGFLGELPALYALKRGGFNVDELRPLDEVKKIAPRSLLLIAGTKDDLVPSKMAEDMLRVAGEPKELYLIEGAVHGDWVSVGGKPYADRLRAFFTKALLEQPS